MHSLPINEQNMVSIQFPERKKLKSFFYISTQSWLLIVYRLRGLVLNFLITNDIGKVVTELTFHEVIYLAKIS